MTGSIIWYENLFKACSSGNCERSNEPEIGIEQKQNCEMPDHSHKSLFHLSQGLSRINQKFSQNSASGNFLNFMLFPKLYLGKWLSHSVNFEHFSSKNATI